MDTTALLAAVKRRAYLPAAGTQYTDGQILSMADEATTEQALPLVLAAREGFMELVQPVTLVYNQSAYQLPARATGGSLLWVRYVDTVNSSLTWEIPHADEKDLQWYPQQPWSPYGAVWYFQGDQLMLVPPPSITTGQIYMAYTARPNALVATTQVLTCIAGTSGSHLVCSAAPGTIGISTGTAVDVVSATGSHQWQSMGGTATVSGSTIDIAHDQGPGNPAVGDYICLAQQTPVPMVPDELHTFIALETARRCALGMRSPLAGALEMEVQTLRTQLVDMLSPRAVKQQKRAINRGSAARARRSWRFWW